MPTNELWVISEVQTAQNKPLGQSDRALGKGTLFKLSE